MKRLLLTLALILPISAYGQHEVKGLQKEEDVAHISGDVGVQILGIRNDTGAPFSGTNLDYTPLALDSVGRLYISGNDIGGLVQAEDDTAQSTEGGIPPLAILDATLNSEAAEGDYAVPKMDMDHRLYVNPYGADPTEWFQSCGTATATTGDVAIKAAVASNRMYVSSITCKNTSASTGSNMDFKDGATQMAVGSIGAFISAGAASSQFTATFPVPLRGSVNTALNFATNTSVSSVTCCASGYISTN